VIPQKCLQRPRRSAIDPNEENDNFHANSTVLATESTHLCVGGGSFSLDRATEKAVNRSFLLPSSLSRKLNFASRRMKYSWWTVFLVVYPFGTTWGEPYAPSFCTRRRSLHGPKPVLGHQGQLEEVLIRAQSTATVIQRVLLRHAILRKELGCEQPKLRRFVLHVWRTLGLS
jgi:hypothetical protein